jgi:putative ATP-binding cassette transporter
MAPGTLRDQFFPEDDGGDRPPDGRILAALERAGLGPAVERAGGLDVERDWTAALSPGEQQRLSIARILAAGPRFVILERPVEALGPERAGELYRELSRARVADISIVGRLDSAGFHAPGLELRQGGEWACVPPLAPEGGPGGPREDEDRAGGPENRG